MIKKYWILALLAVAVIGTVAWAGHNTFGGRPNQTSYYKTTNNSQLTPNNVAIRPLGPDQLVQTSGDGVTADHPEDEGAVPFAGDGSEVKYVLNNVTGLWELWITLIDLGTIPPSEYPYLLRKFEIIGNTLIVVDENGKADFYLRTP